MNYLQDIDPGYSPERKTRVGVEELIRHGAVRQAFESLGYQTVAFETGYEWSRLADADLYLGLAKEPYSMQRLNPFEAMLVKSSLLLPLVDAQYRSLRPRFEDVNFPYQDHINRQLFILQEMPKIARTPGPTFAFIHVLVPHVPYVFGPAGEILTDSGYYGGRKSAPINHEYERKGYTGEVSFINARILEDIQASLAESDTPPVCDDSIFRLAVGSFFSATDIGEYQRKLSDDADKIISKARKSCRSTNSPSKKKDATRS